MITDYPSSPVQIRYRDQKVLEVTGMRDKEIELWRDAGTRKQNMGNMRKGISPRVTPANFGCLTTASGMPKINLKSNSS